jgi:hypothetical protein
MGENLNSASTVARRYFARRIMLVGGALLYIIVFGGIAKSMHSSIAIFVVVGIGTLGFVAIVFASQRRIRKSNKDI